MSADIWSELRIFLAVGHTGSFSKAAENIGLSTPTVSRSVRRLQDVLGTQLVIPGISGAILTKEGSVLLASITKLDFEIHEIELQLKRAINKLDCVVKLGAMEGLVASFVTPLLADFYEQFPNISMFIKLSNGLECIYENQCDLALVFEHTNRPDVTIINLGHNRLVPVASKTYIEKYGIPSRDNLHKHHFISFTNHQTLSKKNEISDIWKISMSEAKLVGEFESMVAYNMAASSGLGIAFVGSYALRDKDLVLLNVVDPVVFPIYLAALKERLDSRHVKVTAEWLTRLFHNNPHWFGGGDETSVKVV